MNNKIKIEDITSIETLEYLVTLLIEAYNRPPWNDKWTPETAKALLTCYYNSPQFIGWVAMAGKNTVGFAVGNVEPHYSGNIFYLRDIIVSAHLQKSGLGRELMLCIKKNLDNSGIKTINLFTNKTIVDFYAKQGFTKMEDMSMMIFKSKLLNN